MSVEELRKRIRDRLPKGRSWYTIANADGEKATIRIYDYIDWLGVSADDFAAELDTITADEIEVQINSPGGDVFDGIAIFNALRAHPARVTTRVDGMAASIASVIVQAGDERIMLTGSQMMIHEAWGFVAGTASDMRDFADVLEKQNEILLGIYVERTGRDADELAKLISDETWFTADEAVEAGLADEVVKPSKTSTTQDINTKTLHDELSEAMAVVSETLQSAERVAALRAEKGKELSKRNRESLDGLRDALGQLDALLNTSEDDDEDSELADELRREHLRLIAAAQ